MLRTWWQILNATNRVTDILSELSLAYCNITSVQQGINFLWDNVAYRRKISFQLQIQWWYIFTHLRQKQCRKRTGQWTPQFNTNSQWRLSCIFSDIMCFCDFLVFGQTVETWEREIWIAKTLKEDGNITDRLRTPVIVCLRATCGTLMKMMIGDVVQMSVCFIVACCLQARRRTLESTSLCSHSGHSMKCEW